MRASSNEFADYLAPDESVVDVGSATLVDSSSRAEGSIGVTDRRVLFLSDDGGFTNVATRRISSIRSEPRTTLTSGGLRTRVLATAGGILAATAFVGVAVLTASALAATLALTTVVGVVLAEHVRRTGADLEWPALADAHERLAGRLEDVDALRDRTEVVNTVDEGQLAVLGLVLGALAAFVGLGVLTGSPLVLVLTLATLGGIGMADNGYRSERDLDRVNAVRRHTRDVSIRLVDGSIVRLRIDSAEHIDRVLTRSTAATPRDPASATSPRV